MKNYHDFKKSVFQKLNKIMEDKIERLVLPRNTFGYSAKNGHYTVSPFGAGTYIISVVLPDLDTYNNFYEEFYGEEDVFFTEINWKRDTVYGYFGVDLYVSEGNLESAQAYIKNIFDAIEE